MFRHTVRAPDGTESLDRRWLPRRRRIGRRDVDDVSFPDLGAHERHVVGWRASAREIDTLAGDVASGVQRETAPRHR